MIKCVVSYRIVSFEGWYIRPNVQCATCVPSVQRITVTLNLNLILLAYKLNYYQCGLNGDLTDPTILILTLSERLAVILIVVRDNTAKSGAMSERWSHRLYDVRTGGDCTQTGREVPQRRRAADAGAHLLSLWQRVDQSQLRSRHAPRPLHVT